MANFRCAASRDLAVNTDRTWDADAAKERIFEWGRSDKGSWSRARKFFLAVDEDAPDSPESYRLPFVDIVDGQPVAVADGIRAAARHITSEIPDEFEVCTSEAREAVYAYGERIHEAQATEEERDAQGIMLARLPLPDSRSQQLDIRAPRQPKSKDDLDEDLLAQIHDPSVVTESSLPYLNMAWGSTDLVDTYFTKMTPRTLQNYAEDATNGIAIQNSHRTDELALGRSFRGKYTAARSGKPGRTEMSFYIPPGLRVTDVATNDVIGGIQWGTIKDVSVGFYGGNLRCSVCGKAMLEDIFYIIFFGGDEDDRDQVDPDAPCTHLPGVEYALRDKQGNKTGERAVAIGEIDDAHCAELSFVFDGATPQAQIKGRQAPVLYKATRMLEAGVLSRRSALALEHQYRSRGVRFPELTTRRFAGFRSPSAGSSPASDAGSRQEPTEHQATPAQSVQDPPHQEAAAMPEPTHDGAPGEGASSSAQQAQSASDGGGGTAAKTASPSPPAVADPMPQIRAGMIRAGLAPEGWTGDVEGMLVRFSELGTEMANLRTLADTGKKAREDIVERCRKMGVRAFGEAGLPEAAYGPVLSRGTYEELQGLYAHLEELGSKRFPGGRATQDGGDDAGLDGHQANDEPIKVPVSSFRAGRR